MPPNDDAGGYGKPPEAGKFQKGKSGNPKGREAGLQNNKTILARYLDGRIPVTINGKRRIITVREALAMQVVKLAGQGSSRLVKLVERHGLLKAQRKIVIHLDEVDQRG